MPVFYIKEDYLDHPQIKQESQSQLLLLKALQQLQLLLQLFSVQKVIDIFLTPFSLNHKADTLAGAFVKNG